MSELNLAQLRELEAKATPGPWAWNEHDELFGPRAKRGSDEWYGERAIIETDGGVYGPRGADRSLIPAMRNALPGLLDRIDALEAENAKLRAAISNPPLN